MATGSILLGVALLILVGLFLARPLLQASQQDHIKLSHRQSLLAEKDAVLDQIRDLDFDHDTGKMPDKIHQQQRQQLLESAAAILQQVEQLNTAPPPNTSETDIDAAIEAAVTKIRQGPSVQNAPKKVQLARSTQAGGFCPNCGQAFDTSDKFCVACGRKL